MINILPALIGIGIITVYTLLVHKKSPEQLWALWHSLISTVVSVLLGISIALLLFYHQQSTINKSTREKYTNLLQLELSSIQSSLLDINPINITTASGIKKAHITFLNPIIIPDAAKSGLFPTEDSWQLLQISTSIQAYNTKVQILLDLFASSKVGLGLDTNVTSAIENIENSRNGILEGIKILCQQSGIDIIENIGIY